MFKCPICNTKMTILHDFKNGYKDYSCLINREDHSYIMRCDDDKDIEKLKLSLYDGEEKLYLKIYYDLGFCKVWKTNSRSQRYTINHTFVPDYSNLEALKLKIKTYILFS